MSEGSGVAGSRQGPVAGERVGERDERRPSLPNGERLFAALLGSSSEGIVVSRLETGEILEASNAFLDMIGYERSEVRGRTSAELGLLLSAKGRREAIERIRREGFMRRVEAGWRTRNGELRRVEITGNVLADTVDAYLLTTIRDVTEARRTERDLVRSRDRFWGVFETNPVPIAITRIEDGLIRMANAACLETFGWEADEFIGRTILDVKLWASVEQRESMLDRLRAEGRVRNLEVDIQTKGGETRHALASIEPFDLEGDDCLISLFHDITDRVRAEQALRESESRFRSVFEHSVDGILLTAADGGILSANPAACRMLGRGERELRRLGWAGVVDPTDASGPPELCERCARGGGHTELTMVRAPGSAFTAEITCSIFEDADGSERTSIIFYDVSDRKAAEQALRAAQEDAQRANAAKTDFLSRMSHELRTPLNAILGFGQLLELDELPLRSAESIAQIVKAGRHLLELINEVLDIQRIETGRLAISPEPVAIRAVAVETIDLMQPLAAEKRVSLDCPACASGEQVVADPQRLRQVLLNLVSNAVKYSPPGATVAVSARDTPAGGVRVSVTDTGPGIAPGQRAHLFLPFERLGQSDLEGTGLGLALSKGLIELMGGSIGVDSIVGTGSTFWIELPKAEAPCVEEAQERGGPARLSLLGTRLRTILYVEDNLSNLALIERLLERLPHVRLVPAMQGRLALPVAKELHPDLVLLDLNLPDMHGSEVARGLRSDEATRDIPIVVISADATPRQVERLHAVGVRDYLTKPLDVKRFFELLDELWATDRGNEAPS